MIIYKESISRFILDCNNNNLVFKIVSELKYKKGIIPTDKERQSWKTTLLSIKDDLENLSNKDSQYILLEFVVPNHKKRIDVLLVGSDEENKNLAIIELKGWSKISLMEDSNLLNANTSYSKYGLVHPAYESFDYYDILKNQYSDIEKKFKLFPISYLPNFISNDSNPLLDKKYEDILKLVNVYSKSNKDELLKFLEEKFKYRVDILDIDYLNRLEYKPSKSFIEHAKKCFEDIKLIGSQREVFEIVSSIINKNINTNKKTIFLISGYAGSGKSIVAFKILGYLLQLGFNTNIIMPGIEFRESIKEIFKKNFNNNSLIEKIYGAYSKLNSDYLIIDEAHKTTANGTCKQFYNELFNSKTNNIIAFIDDLQVINKKGFTKMELIDLATVHNFECIDLRLNEQFRNAGDASYVEWLKKWIFNNDDENTQEFFVPNIYDFKILDSNKFNSLYKEMYETNNVRMVSFWTQQWEYNRLDNNQNIVKTVKIGDSKYAWNPNDAWYRKAKSKIKYLPSKIYELCFNKNFILDKKGYEYIAYFNTIQGSEFEYMFVHIPKLFYLNDNDELDVDLSQLIMDEMKTQVWSTNIKNIDERLRKIKLNKLYFLNRLFICLTRGTKGTYVYIEDEKLKRWLEDKILKSN